MTLRQSTIGLCLGLLTLACSDLATFSHITREQLLTAGDDPARVQYYIDRPIFFEHTSEQTEAAVDKRAGVDERRESYKHEIVVPEKTPGVAAGFSERGIDVRFADNLTLTFTAIRASSQEYLLRDINGKSVKQGGAVEIDGKSYRVYFGRKPGAGSTGYKRTTVRTGPPKLLYKVDVEKSKTQERTEIKGEKLR